PDLSDLPPRAVPPHFQVRVRAGPSARDPPARISRCRLDAGPIYQAAVWVTRYSKYWQAQFDTLAAWLEEIDRRKTAAAPAAPRTRIKRPHRRARGGTNQGRPQRPSAKPPTPHPRSQP